MVSYGYIAPEVGGREYARVTSAIAPVAFGTMLFIRYYTTLGETLGEVVVSAAEANAIILTSREPDGAGGFVRYDTERLEHTRASLSVQLTVGGGAAELYIAELDADLAIATPFDAYSHATYTLEYTSAAAPTVELVSSEFVDIDVPDDDEDDEDDEGGLPPWAIGLIVAGSVAVGALVLFALTRPKKTPAEVNSSDIA